VIQNNKKKKKKKQRALCKRITQRPQPLSRAALHQQWTFNRFFSPLVRESRGLSVYTPSNREPERKERQETKTLPRKLPSIPLLLQRHNSLVTNVIVIIIDLLTNVHLARERSNRRGNASSQPRRINDKEAPGIDETRPDHASRKRERKQFQRKIYPICSLVLLICKFCECPKPLVFVKKEAETLVTSQRSNEEDGVDASAKARLYLCLSSSLFLSLQQDTFPARLIPPGCPASLFRPRCPSSSPSSWYCYCRSSSYASNPSITQSHVSAWNAQLPAPRPNCPCVATKKSLNGGAACRHQSGDGA
jgi:hypothetical protein